MAMIATVPLDQTSLRFEEPWEVTSKDQHLFVLISGGTRDL